MLSAACKEHLAQQFNLVIMAALVPALKSSLFKFVALLLVAAVAKLPYDYYTLLRFFTCPVFGYAAYQALGSKRTLWAWILGGLAVMYNPLLPWHLNRVTWEPINIISAVLLVAVTIRLSAWKKRAESIEPLEG